MDKTGNYQLSLWDKDDRILMEDFNANNAQIETALDGKLGRSQLIQTISQTSSTQTITVDLSDVDWNEWEYVAVTFDHPLIGNAITDLVCYLRTQDKKSINVASSVDSSGSYICKTAPGPLFLLFFPRHDSANPIQSVCVAKASSFAASKTPFAELGSLTLLYMSNSLTSACTVTVWGVK